MPCSVSPCAVGQGNELRRLELQPLQARVVVGVQRVQQGAIFQAAQGRAGRRIERVVQVDEQAQPVIQGQRVHAGLLGDAAGGAALQAGDVQVALQGGVQAGGEVDQAAGFVHGAQLVHLPLAGIVWLPGQRAQQVAGGIVQVEVAEAAALGAPR